MTTFRYSTPNTKETFKAIKMLQKISKEQRINPKELDSWIDVTECFVKKVEHELKEAQWPIQEASLRLCIKTANHWIKSVKCKFALQQ